MYEWEEGMDSVTPWHDDKEQLVRRKIKAGCEWLDAHPGAVLEIDFVIFGIAMTRSKDANDLLKALEAGESYGGAECNSAMAEVYFIWKYGWDAFRQDMRMRKRMEDVKWYGEFN